MFIGGKVQKNGGITLISLVVTIIVLVILAAVSIATLIGENGILTQTGKAKEQTEIAGEKEQIELAVLTTKISELTTENLERELENNGFEIITQGNKTNFREIDSGWTFQGNKEKYYIDFNGEITIVEDRTNLKIGDFVKYIYDSSTNYEINSSYSGNAYSNEQSISQMEDLSWQIFYIDENTGEVLLISSRPTDQVVTLGGALGYNNGVQILNDICAKQYSNIQLGTIARNLNMTDILKTVTDTKRIDIKKAINNGIIKEYTGNIFVPDLYQYEIGSGLNENATKNGIDIDAVYKDYTNGLTTNGYITSIKGNQITKLVTTSSHIYDNQTIQWFENDSKVYDLIFNQSKPFWLSSRTVNNLKNDCAVWGLRTITGTTFSYSNLYQSDNQKNNPSNALRPIVSIKSNIIIDLKSGDGKNDATAYKIYLK